MSDLTTNRDTSIRSLRLFLASPGGVETEREAVRRVVEEVNVPFRRHGWQIELLRWEDRGPASGRAQAEINKDVDRCHVFLGVVWDRWGTPTGEHSSGFAEEWEPARKRRDATGAPELWLCFKDISSGAREGQDATQLERVRRFRESVEREEIVFHKRFRSPAEFQLAIQRELISELLDRSGLAAEAVGSIEVDWSRALAHEPVALLRQGQERERLAEELKESDPGRSAEIFGDLAGELEEIGFAAISGSYRRRVAGALVAAGRDEEALALRRVLLMDALDSTDPIDFGFEVRGLGEMLSPERQWEDAAWEACVEWPLRREASIDALREALRRSEDEATAGASIRIWMRTLWELRIEGGETREVCEEAESAANRREIAEDDELALLLAEALAVEGRSGADELLLGLRGRALALAEEDPRRAARLTARLAIRDTDGGSWTEAEEGFIAAANQAARVPGQEEESAEYFFAAQAISRLRGEIFPSKGWGWRPMAASLRSARETSMSKGRRYEQAGLAAQMDGDVSGATREFLLGRAVHRRAGHLRATLATTYSLARVRDLCDDAVGACVAYCECGDGESARKVAKGATCVARGRSASLRRDRPGRTSCSRHR